MFYCDECREKKNWPESLAMSIGRCEVCGQMRSCWDVKSSALPICTPKPLAQYLAEYIDRVHEVGMPMDYTEEGLKPIFEQALDAYESTENVKIKVEMNKL